MPITVSFRGPMLFVTDDASGPELKDVVNRVVIPDSTAADKHADGTEAKPHSAGLLLIEPNRPQVYIPLGGRQVEILADGEIGAPTVDEEFLGVPPIHEMVGASRGTPLQLKDRLDDGRTTVVFAGGAMSGEMKIEKRMELARYKTDAIPWPVTAMPVWKTNSSKATVRLSGGNYADEVIQVGPETAIYLYNWDVPFPTAEMLRARVEPSKGVVDDDFKWVYNLLEPVNRTWKDWLEGGAELPAPRVIRVDSKFGFTPATCNSARVRGINLV